MENMSQNLLPATFALLVIYRNAFYLLVSVNNDFTCVLF